MTVPAKRIAIEILIADLAVGTRLTENQIETIKTRKQLIVAIGEEWIGTAGKNETNRETISG